MKQIELVLQNDGVKRNVIFPCTEAEYQTTCKELELKDNYAFVRDVVEPKALALKKDTFVNLDEINYLAKRMDSFDQKELFSFFAAVEAGDYVSTKDLIRKCLRISYICECGDVYDGTLQILCTDAEGIGTVLQTDENGCADYSAMTGYYRVTITNAEGELLADFELTNGEMEEHVHAYVFGLEDNAEERYFTFRYACECGEAYPGVLYISYTAEDGETGTLTASEDGIVDYSMLEGTSHIRIETETEVLYELDLSAVQPPDEHTHAYVLNVSDYTAEKYFTLRYVCECGEVYAGALHMTYTNENGETVALAIDAEGKADYSALAAGTYRVMIFADAEQISEFELRIEQTPPEPEEPDDGKDEQPPVPDEGTDDNEQDKPGDESGGQTEENGNAPTLAVLFVLLGVLAACGIAVLIAKKRKNKTEKK